MNLFVKIVSTQLPSFEIVFIRRAVCLLGCVIYLQFSGIPILGPKEKRKLLTIRGCFGFCGLSCGYYAITVLPLSDATVISFFSPVLTALLAGFVLKEKLSWQDYLCTFLCLCGVIFIVRPSFIFHTVVLDDGLSGGARIFAVLIALLGAVAGALAYVTVRTIGSNVNPFVLVTYFSGISTVASVIACAAIPSQRKMAILPPINFILPLLVLSFTALFGQALLNRGLQLEKAGKAASMNYLQIIFSLIFEITLLHTKPEITSLIGAALVFSCSILIALKRK